QLRRLILGAARRRRETLFVLLVRRERVREFVQRGHVRGTEFQHLFVFRNCFFEFPCIVQFDAGLNGGGLGLRRRRRRPRRWAGLRRCRSGKQRKGEKSQGVTQDSHQKSPSNGRATLCILTAIQVAACSADSNLDRQCPSAWTPGTPC